jgi:twinkle protein
MSTEAVAAIWEAQPYAPDEILHISKVIDSQDLSDTRVYPFPFDALTEFLIGQRSGEITLWASGTGSGKTTILRELMHHHLEEERSVGAIMLEESPKETMDDMISLMINKPVRAIRAARLMNDLKEKMGKEPVFMDIIDDLTDEEYADARIKLGQTAFYVYDHLGNNGLKNLCARMEYMAVSLNVDVIVLDHITAAAAGLMGTSSDFDGGSSERLLIDNIMKELRALVSRTGVRIDVVSQLKKTNKAYEEGDRITLQDLRGSGSLASVPNVVVGLERDRQNEDDAIANTTTVRVLKNRLTGRAGVATALYFNRKSGRLEEVDFVLGDSGAEFKPV